MPSKAATFNTGDLVVVKDVPHGRVMTIYDFFTPNLGERIARCNWLGEHSAMHTADYRTTSLLKVQRKPPKPRS
jgi:hypothetical protein